jgi:hypothetical protein
MATKYRVLQEKLSQLRPFPSHLEQDWLTYENAKIKRK